MRKRTTKNTTNSSQAKETVNQAANDNRQPLTFRSAERLLLSAEKPEWVNSVYAQRSLKAIDVPTFLGPSDLLSPVLPGRIATSLILGEMALDADFTVSGLLYAAPLMARILEVEAGPPERRQKVAAQYIAWVHSNGLMKQPDYCSMATGCVAILLLSGLPLEAIVLKDIEWCEILMTDNAQGDPHFQPYAGSLADYIAKTQPE